MNLLIPNLGSTSVKYQILEMPSETALAKGRLERVSDYHGIVRVPSGSPRPTLGEVVAVIPNHVCPVIDLRDTFVATRGGDVVGVWPVDARGRSG